MLSYLGVTTIKLYKKQDTFLIRINSYVYPEEHMKPHPHIHRFFLNFFY